MRSPYAVWRQKFIARHDCDEQDFVRTVICCGANYFCSILLLCAFVTAGTYMFRYLDDAIAKEPFYETLLFCYSTIMTIGYGKVVPKNAASRAFCILYCVLGIPMAFLTLSHIGDLFVEIFWACAGAIRYEEKMSDFETEDRLPLKVVWTLLILHSLLGGLIFHYWNDEMPLISAIYFSFISITTIGYGDLNPTPDNGCHNVVLVDYLSTGIVFMSTLFGALTGHIRQYSKNFYANDMFDASPRRSDYSSVDDDNLRNDLYTSKGNNKCAKNCVGNVA